MPGPAVDLLSLACSLDSVGEHDRALAVLDVAISEDPCAADALTLKGELLRSRGHLRQAAQVFELLSLCSPENPSARYLAGLLSGSTPALPELRPAPWPAPFVRLEDFLDSARHRALLELVTSEASSFEPSTVGVQGLNGREPRVDLQSRTSFRLTDIASVTHWMRPLIAAQIPSVSELLGIAPFAAAEIELKCTAYGAGNFFSAHSDSQFHPERRVSFVYYFHHSPKRYTGGALLLYDGDPSDATKYFPERVTRLETLDNSVVFFPSGAYHEVAAVVSSSDRLEDGRFTLAGHVHAAGNCASTSA